jgi:hypothetical protein
MTDRAIIFAGPMVRAILAGHKSVTRRRSRRWLKVRAGERLWVRETWCPSHLVIGTDTGEPEYQATARRKVARWFSSLRMPRAVSRLTLEATEDARLERLGGITEEEAVREGMEIFRRGNLYYAPEGSSCGVLCPRSAFCALWESLHRCDWEAMQDDEVVRLAFRVVEGPWRTY